MPPKYTIQQLKDKCKSMNLPTYGTRIQLLDRIRKNSNKLKAPTT